MRRILCILLILTVITTTAIAQRSGRSARSSSSSSRRTSSSTRVVNVRGYTRKDGTYVRPHKRTAPNNTKLDNWSTKGNVNPYTGEPGTIDPYPENGSRNAASPISVNSSSEDYSLTNQDVINMVRRGLATEDIKSIVIEAQTAFDTSVPALLELKRAGVPDEVILEMTKRETTTVVAAEPLPVPMNTNATSVALKLASPEVRGFRLGMNISSILKRFEKDLHVIDRGLGLRTVNIYPSLYAINADEFKGINEISLEFTDERLSAFDVRYDSSVRWTNANEFYRAVCEGLGLQFIPNSTRNFRDVYEENHSDFVIRIEYNFGIMPELHIFSPSAKQLIEKRRTDEELRKRQAFRP